MNYFLFSGIPGIINISWIIVQYCPILSNSCQTIHFYFIHLAFLSLLHSREVSEYLLIHRMRFFLYFSITPILYFSAAPLPSSTTLSYTPPIFFPPILYYPYSLTSATPLTLHLPSYSPSFSDLPSKSPPLLLSSTPLPLLPYSLFLLSSTPPVISYYIYTSHILYHSPILLTSE